MEAQIQFVQISPKELQETILAGVKIQLEQLKKEFTPKQPTEYLTRAAVSELFSVDPSTVDNWARSKKLIRHCIGNRVYFKRSELEQSLITIK